MMRNPNSRFLRLGVLLAGLSMAAVACGGNGGGGDGDGQLSGASFTVAKEFTEQLILIDMYWEYTGTGWAELLGNEADQAPTDEAQLFETVAQRDLQENDVKWIALAPVNNTYALATSAEASEDLGVTTLSDYAELANSSPQDASLCAASEFIDRADGLPGLEDAYGFELPESSLAEVDLGIIFTRVPQRDPCNFGEVFATDGRIPASDMLVLEDDESFFVIYNLALTMNNSIYELARAGRRRPRNPTGPTTWHRGGGSSLRAAAYSGQKPLEILTARTAGTKVRRDPGVPLLDGPPSDGQLGVGVQHLQRLGTAHVARVRPQEVVEL
ncbi:MAG TPA: glycine betaine ABC transporter substrate-binding protein [Nocardioidaceae bacterium]|nr:glycine betaine ABC transporter substrate-binding protein [Nocardioidaceae bacterium]